MHAKNYENQTKFMSLLQQRELLRCFSDTAGKDALLGNKCSENSRSTPSPLLTGSPFLKQASAEKMKRGKGGISQTKQGTGQRAHSQC